ncbi:DEAD/DEAH box helicase [Thermomonospora cellulosilytica]|uniref:ATP-dependent Lhr-like helicase n=1 Tax=Thermomonospora cellulosilytica TaxID=1411118 RepID=A0A7W3MZY6_9ACTN|nr:DEAD/DEAH box helicase [Thermomonospora cellulosilytica]MBA9004990.1 ATP-dependent Lhr-like helicase [Thermomonospora cellulosilytica]
MTARGGLHPSLVHHIVNSLGWSELRPSQSAAMEPLLQGSDALLLAPTAGGKTEAAVFPLLSRMTAEGWTAPSVIYVAPLKALLNNLLPRLETYTGWLGRRAGLWHGDITSRRRARLLHEPPDLLLTTPESLESMLVSTKVDHVRWFGGLHAVVVDEVHAFAGDDRGWHLLAVLERLARIAGRPVQRVGLSATVGNPDELLRWLQGTGRRPGRVVAPDTGSGRQEAQVGLDHVGSVANAAKVIAALHQGEKRLVFCDSRRLVEELGAALRARGVTTFLSHASLSADERRRAEQAFAETRDCVIVSTSTLELGIDVGDLDRVIQINAPSSVAAFLQRLGRTGRRPGGTRNCLFLGLNEAGTLAATGLALLWSRGWVEPVQPPPDPRHIVAQQILALCLQEHQVGARLWAEWWRGLGPFGTSAESIVRHLVEQGYLDSDGGMLFIGPEAERRYGHRHFMELTTSFTAMPEFTVLCGREEIGRTDPALLSERVDGPRLLLLAGRSWRVTWTDWKRRRCHVEPADGGGKARWTSPVTGGASFTLAQAVRSVLLGEDPPVRLTQRAEALLTTLREQAVDIVHPGGSVITRVGNDVRWWTWAGHRANATLAATLDDVADAGQRVEDFSIRLRSDLTPRMWKAALTSALERLRLPAPSEEALRGLKYSDALPRHLAEATLSARLADLPGATRILKNPTHISPAL